MKKLEKIFNTIVRHTNWYNNCYWNGALKFARQTFDTEIVCLGSGAAVHAFNFEKLSIKGENWALSPQSLVHDYNILRNFFSYLKENAVVIITICPFSCLYSNYDKSHNFKYYPFLHPATISNFDDIERTRAFLTYQNPFRMMPAKCINNTLKEAFGIVKHFFFRRKKKTNFAESAENIINSWKMQFSIKNLDGPLSEQHRKEQETRKVTLLDMVKFCKERNLKPVIVIPPMHQELTSRFTEKFLYNYLKTFIAGIDVKIYDCMKFELLKNDEYYENALFLNHVGAKIFTQWLINQLRKNNIL